MQEQEIKSNLLGSCRKLKKTGNYVVDPKIVLNRGGETDCYIRYFCTGCGIYLDLIEKGARLLSERYNFKIIDRSNSYIEVDGCIACSDDFENARIK